MSKKVAIIIPTYNAHGTIVQALKSVLKTVKNSYVIVVDDSSPDETQKVIKKSFSKNKKIILISRPEKGGRGSAVLRGFKEALKNRKTQFIVEMDADLCHDPKYIPKLLEVCKTKDIAIASKYLKESIISGLPLKRKIFSKLANFFIKSMLRIPLSDFTNGFRCYKRNVIEQLDIESIKSKGFIVLSEIIYRAHKKGFRFGEIPIHLKHNDSLGSNFNRKEIKEAFLTISRLSINKLTTFIWKHKEIFLLLFLTLIFFHKIILNPTKMIYPAQDLPTYSFKKIFLIDHVTRYKELPLWNPYMFSGTPFIADTEIPLFYPVHLLFFFLPIDSTFGYIFMLDFFLIGLFTYLFCKTIQLSSFSSLIAAVCAEFSGLMTTYLFPAHVFIVDSIIWFPLLLLFVELGLQKRKLHYGVLASLPLSCMILSGNPQIAVYGFLAICIYFMLRYKDELIVQRKIIFNKILLLPIISLILCLGISAIQIVPTSEFSKLSIRSGGISLPFSTSFYLPPKQLLAIIFPYFFGSGLNGTYWGKGNFASTTIYVGILPLLMTLIALKFRKNRYVLSFVTLALFSLLFSFGNSTPLFPFFHEYVPEFNMFRVPSRFLYVFVFSLSVLTGIGTENIFLKNDKEKNAFLKKLILLLFGACFFLFSLLVFMYFNKNSFQYYEKYILKNSYAVGQDHKIIFSQVLSDIRNLITLLIFSTIIFLLVAKRVSTNIVKGLFLLIVFIPLFLFGVQFYDMKNPEDIYKIPTEVREIKKDKSIYRVFDLSGSFVASLPRNFVQSVTGFDAVYMKDYRNFLWKTGEHEETPYESFFQFKSLNNTSNLKLLNVKYIVSKRPLDNSDLRFIYKDLYYVYELKNTLPRAYVLRNNFLDEESLSIKEYSPNRIVVNTTLQKPGSLVLSEIWYPGWKATDNAATIEIYKTQSLFRTIDLKSGKHEAVFTFDPKSYKLGRYISFVTLIFLLIYFFLHNFYSRKRKNKMASTI